MTAITTRQDKVQTTIARLTTRLEKLEAKQKVPFTEKEIAKYIKLFNEHNSYNIEKGFCDKCSYELAIKNLTWNLEYDIKTLKEQLANNSRKLKEAQRLDKREEERTAKKAQKEKKERFITENLPQILVDFAEKIEKRTIALHELNYAKYSSMPWPKYNDYSEEAALIRFYHSTTMDSLKRDAKSDSERLVKNLFYRVYNKVGDIEEFDLRIEQGNEYEGAVLTGNVKGNKGKATVKTVYAGGYNIQCFHVRCLVK